MKSTWSDSKGYVVIERKTIALLQNEAPSVGRVFQTLLAQSFIRPIGVRMEDNTYEIWNEGSRPWSQRLLAEAANVSINTLRKALHRLKKIGLIRFVATKLGTVVQVLRFFQYLRRNKNADTGVSASQLPRPGDTRSSPNDHYRSASNILQRSTHDLIADAHRKEVELARGEGRIRIKALIDGFLGRT